MSGPAIVGLRSSLPVKGIGTVLGNDLTGGRVEANPCVSDVPHSNTVEATLGLFPACAVTQAMAKRALDQVWNNNDRQSEEEGAVQSAEVPSSVPLSTASESNSEPAQQMDELEDTKNSVLSTQMLVKKQMDEVQESFSQVVIDCIGPLPKTQARNQYLLTIMCLSTHIPKVVPLQNIKAPTAVKALLKFFTFVGLLQYSMCQLGIKIHSVPLSDTRSNGKVPSDIEEHDVDVLFGANKDWDEGVHLLLFAAPEIQKLREQAINEVKASKVPSCYYLKRDVLMWKWRPREVAASHEWRVVHQVVVLPLYLQEYVHEGLGFSPIELVFGHVPRWPLKLLKELGQLKIHPRCYHSSD